MCAITVCLTATLSAPEGGLPLQLKLAPLAGAHQREVHLRGPPTSVARASASKCPRAQAAGQLHVATR
jgi:hypothetical protein